MVGDVFNLLAAVLSTVSAGFATRVLLQATDVPPSAVWAAGMAVAGSLCWVVAALTTLVERRRRR
jgi:hypothetical protein